MPTYNDVVPSSDPGQQLKITYQEIQREIGRLLGFNRDPSNWDAIEIQDSSDIIRSSEREFYFQDHDWSFMIEADSVSLNAGVSVSALPLEFIRIVSSFTNGDGDGGRLLQVDDSELRAIKTDQTGRPEYFSIRFNSTSELYEADVFPAPNKTTTLNFRYLKSPAPLSGSNIYHLGPSVHSETFLECALANAEKKLNPETADTESGFHQRRYQEFLARSIEFDKKVFMETD